MEGGGGGRLGNSNMEERGGEVVSKRMLFWFPGGMMSPVFVST